MTWEAIQSIIRHLLTLAAGYLVGQGIIDEGAVMEVVGAVMTLIALGWSFWNKKKLREAPAVASG